LKLRKEIPFRVFDFSCFRDPFLILDKYTDLILLYP